MRPAEEVIATVQKPFHASDRTAGGAAPFSLRYSGTAAEPATPDSRASRFIGKELRRALQRGIAMASSIEPPAYSRLSAADKQRIEIEYWRDSPTERPGAESLDNLLNKMAEARIFVAYLEKLKYLLADRGTVVELGAGQGWSSCIYKKLFPAARVIATDISSYAIESIEYWHRIFGVRTDGHYACKSYATEEPPDSADLVYCFAAAHHFVEHG